MNTELVKEELMMKDNPMDENSQINILQYKENNDVRVQSNENELEVNHIDSFGVLDTVDKITDRALRFRQRLVKLHKSNFWIKIGVWNLQSLNLKIKQRYMKLEFLRDLSNENKLDIIWMIDVNDMSTLILNGFKKYSDN
jgi:hypothetical protein